MPVSKNIEQDIIPRVAKLEGQMTEMASAVSRLASTVEKQERLQEERDTDLHKKLDAMIGNTNQSQINTAKELAERGRTNWSVLVSAGSLILVIATYLINVNIGPIKESQDKAIEQESRLVHRELDLIQELNRERFLNLDERVDRLEVVKHQ